MQGERLESCDVDDEAQVFADGRWPSLEVAPESGGRSPGLEHEGSSRRVLLPTANLAARAGTTIRVDDGQVAHLAACTGSTAIVPSVDHDPAAKPGADREEHEAGECSSRAGLEFSPGRGLCVVGDGNRSVQGVCQALNDSTLTPVDADREIGGRPS